MRIHLSLILFGSLAVATPMEVSPQGDCGGFLLPTSGHGVVSSPTSTEVLSVIALSEKILDLGVKNQLIKPKVAKHLLEDLAELKNETNPKANQAAFPEMLSQWREFLLGVEGHLSAYSQMEASEKKQWKVKMELPVAFATAHWVTFLETRSRKFDYRRMEKILRVHSNMVKEGRGDLKLFLFLFEKEVQRFYSTWEFRKCLA